MVGARPSRVALLLLLALSGLCVTHRPATALKHDLPSPPSTAVQPTRDNLLRVKQVTTDKPHPRDDPGNGIRSQSNSGHTRQDVAGQQGVVKQDDVRQAPATHRRSAKWKKDNAATYDRRPSLNDKHSDQPRLDSRKAAEERRLDSRRAAEERRLDSRRAAEERRLDSRKAPEERRLDSRKAPEERRLDSGRTANDRRLIRGVRVSSMKSLAAAVTTMKTGEEVALKPSLRAGDHHHLLLMELSDTPQWAGKGSLSVQHDAHRHDEGVGTLVMRGLWVGVASFALYHTRSASVLAPAVC